jgi:hypothetical protein
MPSPSRLRKAPLEEPALLPKEVAAPPPDEDGVAPDGDAMVPDEVVAPNVEPDAPDDPGALPLLLLSDMDRLPRVITSRSVKVSFIFISITPQGASAALPP